MTTQSYFCEHLIRLADCRATENAGKSQVRVFVAIATVQKAAKCEQSDPRSDRPSLSLSHSSSLKREMSFDSSFCAAAEIALIPLPLSLAQSASSMSRLSLGAISRNERTDGSELS